MDSRTEKIKYRRKIAKKTGKCGLCPMHDNENASKQRRDDRYKNHRR